MAYPETRTDRLLDAVHDYVPERMRAWIEERAFNKQTQSAWLERAEGSTNPEMKAWLSDATPNTPQWDKVVADQTAKNEASYSSYVDKRVELQDRHLEEFIEVHGGSIRLEGVGADLDRRHAQERAALAAAYPDHEARMQQERAPKPRDWLGFPLEDKSAETRPTYALQSGFAKDYDTTLRASVVTQEDRTAGFLRSAAANTQNQTVIQQQGKQMEQSQGSGMER